MPTTITVITALFHQTVDSSVLMGHAILVRVRNQNTGLRVSQWVLKVPIAK
jgi:hypothetical protein